ncbi:putative ABC transporter substrate binding protein [Gordonia araii NBRC 100433]|uniref:Putative ABC transporter substrate binding protein n=1 Tax=Gordonia araii NBRC 100433 TaxID=1073574 RepID=G7H431_9ACTN|nr:thiamine ABC transporter substrate-binding protein [Gordonia araii]NNG96329.1 thiamine ABC transporter substrate-binding protein [Gordonia araii NBRC 100433]GAB10606.1 putative ABC transporter substrate binding protein [Gordonia araii NBRC 100433]
MRSRHATVLLPMRRVAGAALVAALAVGLASGCGDSKSDTVTMLTHDSFELPSSVIDEFHKTTGMTLRIARSGDAGKLASQISLTPGSPKGDVVYGIDNTFASRPVDAGALEPYVSPEAAKGSDEFALPDAPDLLTAINRGDVCLNVDSAWYDRRDQQPPASLDDLVKPEYRGQAALLDPGTSSPGISFLLTTVGQKRGGWQDYWRKLVANDATIVSGWETAYNQLFSAGAGHGSKPIVISYASSPAATPGTAALLETCFRQVEYAGILKGTPNVEGARKAIDFLLSPAVQKALPSSMYVYPIVKGTPLPDGWATRAPIPEWTVNMPPEYIAKNRETWLQQWRDAVGR